MANLGEKGDLFVARFRFEGKEFKKSLKTTRKADAESAMHAIERAIHGLTTGMLQVPPGVAPGITFSAAARSNTRPNNGVGP